MTRRTVQLVGSLIAIVAIAWALARGIGADTFSQRADDLAYYAGQHMLLVVYSMALAIAVGVPAGVLSRPRFQHQAERFMQVFNIGNTIPSLAVPSRSASSASAACPRSSLFLASLLPITRNAYEGMKNVPAAAAKPPRASA